VRVISYVLAGGAQLTYVARDEAFAKHKDEFEAAAAATIAAADPAWWAVGRDEIIVVGLILAAISIVVASVLNRRLRTSAR
jgi:hypothetical protein